MLRNSIESSSAGEGSRLFISISAQTARFASSSQRAMSSAESSTEKSSVMSSAPMWKPTFSPPKRRWTVPEKMCSPEWPCIRGKRAAQSTEQETSAPGSSGAGRVKYMVSSSSRTESISMPATVPESASWPPPPGKTALRSSTASHAPPRSEQESTRAVNSRHSPSR